MPQMHPVDSSNLRAVGYDADSQELTVTFNGGRSYVYKGVPNGVLEDLLSAASAGKYFNDNVRGVYQEVRL